MLVLELGSVLKLELAERRLPAGEVPPRSMLEGILKMLLFDVFLPSNGDAA